MVFHPIAWSLRVLKRLIWRTMEENISKDAIEKWRNAVKQA